MRRLLATLRLRLRSVFQRPAVEAELDEELRFHLDRQTEALIAQGMPPAEARRAARRAFGGVEQHKETSRDARGVRLIEEIAQDLRYGARALRRSPVFAAVAVLSLGIAIGANTTAFNVIDGWLLKPLPVPDPSRLVALRERQLPERVVDDLPYPLLLRLRDEAGVFAGLTATTVIDRSNITLSGPGGGPDPGRARVAIVTGDYFATFRVQAARGRTLTPDDDREPGGHPVAVISDRYRRRRLGDARDVLGRSLTLHRTTYTIVGVMPPGFTGDWVGRPVDIWVPFAMHQQVMVEFPYALTRPIDQWLHVIGRLAPGVSLDRAQAAVQTVYQRVQNEWNAGAAPEDLRQLARRRLEVAPAAHGYSLQRDALARPITILAVTTALVLLIACANLASLLLARAAARERELAVRLAMGAGAARLRRQLVTESLLLAALGAALGLILAIWGTRALTAAMTASPVQMFFARSSWFAFDVPVHARSLLFTIALGLGTGVLFSLAPAARASRVVLASALGSRGATASASGRRFGLGRALVVAQVALSLAVVIAAGLLARSLANLRAENLGFERQRLLLAWTQPSATGRDTLQLRELWHRVQERLGTLPGVASVSASNQGILTGTMPVPTARATMMTVEGEPDRPSTLPMFRTFVTPRYFETMGIPLVRGRDFTERDTDSAPPVLIINQSMAHFYFGDRDPVGRRVHMGSNDSLGKQVIGVVGDFITGTPRSAGQRQLLWYLPYRDRDSARRIAVMMVAVRATGDPRALAEAVRRELQSIDPTLPVLKIDTVEEQLADVLAPDRLIAGLATGFGLVAVLLVCLGLYGLIAYSTARRTSEIGIRMALGARREDVLGLVLGESLRLVLAGVVLGVPIALAMSRLVPARLYGIGAADPVTVAGATVLMAVVAAGAAWVPAARAALIDPISALRSD